MLLAEVINSFNEGVLNDVMNIKRHSFPEEWQFDDAESDFSEKLKDNDNINIFLKSDDKRVGYLLSIPHNNAVRELKDDDTEMSEDNHRYYIYTIGIIPQYRHIGGLSELLKTFVEECKKRGVQKASLHARVKNGLSGSIQKRWAVTKLRRIDKWKYYAFQEPTDYIEASF